MKPLVAALALLPVLSGCSMPADVVEAEQAREGELLADADDCEIEGLSRAWGLDLRAWGQPPPPDPK